MNRKELTAQLLNIGNSFTLDELLSDERCWNIKAARINYVLKLWSNLKVKSYLHNDIKKLRCCSDKELLKRALLDLFAKCNDDGKMLLSKVIYFLELLDNEATKLIMDFARATKNKDYRYWVTQDISTMNFALQTGFYPEYYNDRKVLLKKIAEENNFKIPKKNTLKTSEKKLLIITYILEGSLFNSVQRVATMVAKGLCDKYDSTEVVCLDSFFVGKEDSKSINTVFKKQNSIKDAKEIQQLFGKNITVKYARGKSYKERLQDALNIIYGYNPTAIVDISDEYSPISYIYAKDFRTYYLLMRAASSSSCYTVIGGEDWKFKMENDKFNSVDLSKTVKWIFPEYVPPKDGNFTRQDIGIEEEAFVIVSAGNNNVFKDDEIDEICSMLKRNAKFVWLLVGTDGTSYLHANYKDLFEKKQIIEWGFEKKLAALFSVCNVILRANATGGSGATAIAAMQGLPVIMTNFVSDPMRWLGYDYSSMTSFKELTLYIEALSKDVNLYEAARTRVLEKVNEVTDSELPWNNLAKIIDAQ